MLNNELNFSTSSFLNDFSQKNSFSKEINNFSPNKIPLKLSNKKYFPKFYQKSNSSNNSFSSEKNDSPLKNCLTNELLETINGENNSPINNIKNNNIEFFNKIYTFDKDKTPTKVFNNNNNFKISKNIFESNSALYNSNNNNSNLCFTSGRNLYFNNKDIIDQNQNIENKINEFNYELNFVNYSFNNILTKNYKNLSIYKDCEISNFEQNNKNNKNDINLNNNKSNLFDSNINKSHFLLDNNNFNNNNNNINNNFNIKSNLKDQKTNFNNKNNEEKNGEWICSKCQNLNFYFRKFCNRCNNSKN